MAFCRLIYLYWCLTQKNILSRGHQGGVIGEKSQLLHHTYLSILRTWFFTTFNLMQGCKDTINFFGKEKKNKKRINKIRLPRNYLFFEISIYCQCCHRDYTLKSLVFSLCIAFILFYNPVKSSILKNLWNVLIPTDLLCFCYQIRFLQFHPFALALERVCSCQYKSQTFSMLGDNSLLL